MRGFLEGRQIFNEIDQLLRGGGGVGCVTAGLASVAIPLLVRCSCWCCVERRDSEDVVDGAGE